MGKNSKIAWKDHTFNPWWGCTRVSAGCDSCYAEGVSKRFGFDVWGDKPRRFFGDNYWRGPLKWNAEAAAAGVRQRVFCGSMCDVFEDLPNSDRDEDARTRLFQMIEQTPSLTWMLLTKRPENMIRMAPHHWESGWPHNVWAMTTVENQEMAELRILELLRVPAVVRGLSCEPLLCQIDLYNDRRDWIGPIGRRGAIPVCRGIQWVIAGGESGPGARPMHPDWARSIRDQCRAASLPFFFKQWGEWIPSDQTMANGRPGNEALASESVETLKTQGRHHTWRRGKPAGPPYFGMNYSSRVGKKAAGRLLDGREWNEIPEAAATCR
jgi:protein gp37